MGLPVRPPFILYLIRHSSSVESREVGGFLYHHFSFQRHREVVGHGGLSVVYRAPSQKIDWTGADATAVVVLMDECLNRDPEWREYADQVMRQAASAGPLARCFPVMLQAAEHSGPAMVQQALLWHRWTGNAEDRKQRLACDLANEFSSMLRYRLSATDSRDSSQSSTRNYLAARIKVFLSHSKHDQDGAALARSMRSWLEQNSHLSSFFDTHDIPPGMPFREVLLEEIDDSAVLVLYTDSYSSRDGCRQEVIEAKRRHVPMVVANCLRDRDRHSIPYLGNTPVVRVSPNRAEERFRTLIQCLLEEVFRTYLWRCRIREHQLSNPEVLFLSRTPELLSLASLSAAMHSGNDAEIVYPNAPMSVDEARLFAEIAPRVLPLTLREWLRTNP